MTEKFRIVTMLSATAITMTPQSLIVGKSFCMTHSIGQVWIWKNRRNYVSIVIIFIRCLLRFFYNVPHQTTQHLNLIDRFRDNKNFFDTLPTRNNYSKLKQNFYIFWLFISSQQKIVDRLYFLMSQFNVLSVPFLLVA